MDRKVIVIEFGNSFVRGGFASEFTPRFIIPNSISSKINSLTCDNIITRIIFEFMINIFTEYLPSKIKECRVVIIENMFSPTYFRDALITVLLSDMQVINY
jgi:hypothetical protein